MLPLSILHRLSNLSATNKYIILYYYLSFLPICLAVSDSSIHGGEVEMVRSIVKQICFGDLWVVLCECLDLVRDLEGIVDTAPEVETSSSLKKEERGDNRGRGRGRGNASRGSGVPGSSRASAALARARSHALRGPQEERLVGLSL